MIGPLVGVDDVCEGVETILRTWMPSVLAELAALGKPEIAPPASYEQLPEEDASTTAAYPAVVVSSPGLAEDPIRHGDGTYTDCWDVVVSFMLRGESYRDTAKRVRCYATAIRAAVVQHPGIAGLEIEAVTPGAMLFSRAKNTAARTFGMGHVAFEVSVLNTLDESHGPDDPPDGDGITPDYPTQTSADITITKET